MSLGLILTLPMSGILAEELGWESVFYVTGGLGCVWAIAFFLLASDSPQSHKRISKEELKYIEASTSSGSSSNFGAKPPLPPVGAILKNKAFW